jgi:hypothetical protein
MQNQNQDDILKILALRSSRRFVFRLTLAMMTHPRLNSDSLFSLIDPSLVRIIAEFSFPREEDIQEFINFAVPRTPSDIHHAFLRLYGEIIADWHNFIKKVILYDFYSSMDMILRGTLQPDKIYYIILHTSRHPENLEYETEKTGEHRYVRIHFNDPAIVKTIDETLMEPDGHRFCKLRIINPLDKSVLAEDVIHDPSNDLALYGTKYFHIETEGDELRSLIRGMMKIVFAEEKLVSTEEQTPPNGSKCPQCRYPMGEGGIPGALCIRCERARDQV